jgi:hypothetical protein
LLTSGEKSESPLMLERGLVQSALEVLVAIEIAIRLLDHDVALEQQPLEHLLDVEARVAGIARAEGDVLQVEKHGHRGVGGPKIHAVVHVTSDHDRFGGAVLGQRLQCTERAGGAGDLQ